MSIEDKPMIIPEKHEKLDAALFDRLEDIRPQKEIYKLLAPDKAIADAEKTAFFAARKKDQAYQPDLRPTIQAEDILKIRADLRTFKRELKNIEHNINLSDAERLVARVYRWKINEMIAGMHMLEAADRDSQDSAKSAERFAIWNQFIYGKPDIDTFTSSAKWIETFTEPQDTDDEALITAKSELKALIAPLAADYDKYAPKTETFATVKTSQENAIELMTKGGELPTKGTVTPEIGEPLIRLALDNIGLTDYERQVTSAASWDIDHNNKTLNGPALKNMVLRRFIGLVLGHEIGSHGVERTNGLRGALKLAGIGLDRYETGNEGRAVIAEQAPYDSFEAFEKITRWQDIVRRHFAISLAVGVDQGDKPRSFSETFKIINAFDRVIALGGRKEDNPLPVEDVLQKADTKTWDLLKRVCKGTHGGGAYLKDMVYLEGNIKIWKLADKNPDIVAMGDIAKFDVSNPRHICALIALGVLPETASQVLAAFDQSEIDLAQDQVNF